MIKLSQITPETTYPDIKQAVEANLKEGWGVPYEGIILMARTLEKLGKEMEETKARLADAQKLLPVEDANEERRRRQKQKWQELALDLTTHLIRTQTTRMGNLDYSGSDMEELFRAAGISYYQFEGQ